MQTVCAVLRFHIEPRRQLLKRKTFLQKIYGAETCTGASSRCSPSWRFCCHFSVFVWRFCKPFGLVIIARRVFRKELECRSCAQSAAQFWIAMVGSWHFPFRPEQYSPTRGRSLTRSVSPASSQVCCNLTRKQKVNLQRSCRTSNRASCTLPVKQTKKLLTRFWLSVLRVFLRIANQDVLFRARVCRR